MVRVGDGGGIFSWSAVRKSGVGPPQSKLVVGAGVFLVGGGVLTGVSYKAEEALG
jgi:hypothetical protein